MQDYKRRAAQSQESLDKLQRSARYHDDHLRVVDIWWDQLLDEVRVVTQLEHSTGEKPEQSISSQFLSAIPEFTQHLAEKRQVVMDVVLNAFKVLKSEEPRKIDIEALEKQNVEVLGQLKMLKVEVEVLRAEKAQREPKITDLQERLASSQRKIDRQKSITLARIEAQARRAPQGMNQEKNEETKPSTNQNEADQVQVTTTEPAPSPSPVQSNPALLLELETINTELSKAKSLNSQLETRISNLTDAEIADSVPYKALKTSNEHLRGRIEHLEQIHAESVQELDDLKSARSKFRDTLVSEHDLQYKEILTQLAKTEQDLARVRSARDDLHAGLQLRKSQDDAKAASAREIGELADTQATRIAALEGEVARLKEETAEPNGINGTHGTSDLNEKLEKLQRENESLKNELPTMEKAFNQAHEQNVRKVMELVSVEDKIAKLQAEKAKADQKYFAAMKAKDQLALELKTTKTQGSKQMEALTRLQESDEAAKQRIQNLEKQISSQDGTRDRYRQEVGRLMESLELAKLTLDQSKTKLAEATQRMDSKESEVLQLTNTQRTQTQELDGLKTQLERIKATSALTNGSNDDQVQVYRGIAMCSVCNLRWKDTVITSCGHVFCKECVDKRVETRQRRCPNCNKGVSKYLS